MKPRRALSPRYRLAVLSRAVAAVAGGYGVAVILSIALAWVLPMSREEAGTTATMIALLALPIAMMGCFAARNAGRAWAGIILAAMLAGGIALAAGWRP
ncbi:MAG: DUF3649 domain-containing protein [Candidatus Sphingomonas colombiensis]|nr:DUF3649 domain-containing protein [Sphingomonas sp.]WEK43739.1 MAG: DUF3649 domain-containing protein [Sphingomonas sp.]